MKTLFFTLYCSLFLLVNPSQTDNFSIENGQLIWQKIYNTELSKEQLIKEIRNSGQFKNISLYEDNLTAEIFNLTIDHKKSDVLPTSNILAANSINSYVIIDLKDTKYRVTLKSIKLTPKTKQINFNQEKFLDIETIALNKDNNAFSNKFLKKISKKMDFTFQKMTDFNDTGEKNQW